VVAERRAADNCLRGLSLRAQGSRHRWGPRIGGPPAGEGWGNRGRKARVEPDERSRTVHELAEIAERFDALADMAELMGDDDGAARFRAESSRRRAQAMALLDE
jgi:hypothetical protein